MSTFRKGLTFEKKAHNLMVFDQGADGGPIVKPIEIGYSKFLNVVAEKKVIDPSSSSLLSLQVLEGP